MPLKGANHLARVSEQEEVLKAEPGLPSHLSSGSGCPMFLLAVELTYWFVLCNRGGGSFQMKVVAPLDTCTLLGPSKAWAHLFWASRPPQRLIWYLS